jgi:iron complex outermembrane receptor protein
MKSRTTKLAVTGGCALLSVYCGSQALAQDAEQTRTVPAGLEEVIVTSQKRAESVQDVPIAITAISSAQLEQKGIANFMDVARSSPAIVIQSGYGMSSTPLVFMRGQGSLAPATVNSEGAVGIYQDGFYNARAMGATLDMGDVERVEVLRGPQGTLYGRNTTGGAVNVISKLPTGELGFKQSVDFGNRNMYRVVSSLNLPRWNQLSAKVTGLAGGIDGYVENPGGGNDFGDQQQAAGKLQLRWQPADDFTADYFLSFTQNKETVDYRQGPSLNGRTMQTDTQGTTYVYFAPTGPANVAYRPFDVPWWETRDVSQGLTLAWDVNDSLTIKSLTGYHTIRQTTDAGNEYYADTLGYALGQQVAEDNRQFSQELQFVGDLLDGRLSYAAGLYYFRETGSKWIDSLTLGFNRGTMSNVDAEGTSTAAFTQVTWRPERFDDRLELTLGGRYTMDEREAGASVTPHSISPFVPDATVVSPDTRRKYNRFDPSFTVNYHWTEDFSTYAKYSTGYRAGGIYTSVGPSYGALATPFDPETLAAYEIGFKSDWFDNRVRLNLAAYYSDFEDMQMVVQLDPSKGAGGPTRTANAGQAAIKGIELDLLVNPLEDLTLGASYSYLNTDLRRVDVIPCSSLDNGQVPNPGGCPNGYSASSPYHVGDNVKDEFTMPYTPEHSFDVNATYTLAQIGNGALSAFVDYRYQGDTLVVPNAGPATNNRDKARMKARGLLDGRLTYAADLSAGQRLSVSLWGRNLTDKRYPQNFIPTSTVVNGTINFGEALTVWAPPRSYGFSASYEF